MATTMKTAPFVISRVLDAPRDLVWKCSTDPEHMKQWWGPKGFKVIASKMDLRVGGTYIYGCRRRTVRRCGASSSIAKSSRRNVSISSTRFRTRRAAPPVIRATHHGRSRCFRSSPSRNCPAAKPSSRSVGNRITRQNKSGKPSNRTRQHAHGLERHPRETRRLSRKSKVAAHNGGHYGDHQTEDHTLSLVRHRSRGGGKVLLLGL